MESAPGPKFQRVVPPCRRTHPQHAALPNSDRVRCLRGLGSSTDELPGLERERPVTQASILPICVSMNRGTSLECSRDYSDRARCVQGYLVYKET